MELKQLTTTNEMVIDEQLKISIYRDLIPRLIAANAEVIGETEAERIAYSAADKWMKTVWDGKRNHTVASVYSYLRKGCWYGKGHYESLRRSRTLSLDSSIGSEGDDEVLLGDVVSDPTQDPCPLACGLDEEQRKTVRKMLCYVFKDMHVNDKTRRLFVRRFWGNVEYKDLAREFHTSENNCQQIVFRIKNGFMKRFGRGFVKERFALCA